MKKTIFTFLTLSLVSMCIILFYAHKKRVSIYNYNTSIDYAYDFEVSNAEIVNLKLTNNTLKVPFTANNNITAFLKVDLETTLSGKFFNPQINIYFNDKIISQQFEIGANKIRYLNVSEALNSKCSEIKLETKNVKIVSDEVTLFLFKNDSLKDKRILVLSPHPDDAEIAAYGLYASYPENTYVVTVTAGDAGEFKYDEIYQDSLTHYLQKGKIRTWNSLTVPMLGGVKSENIINLGYFNEALPTMYKNDTALIKTHFTKTYDISTFRKQNISKMIQHLNATSNWVSLINDFTFLLDSIKPDVIITPYPKLDSHLDHKFTSIALFEALKKIGINKGKLLLYTNHLPESGSYPYGKTRTPITLPPNFESSLYFKNIYSFPLSKKLQQEKILALDAMNDLRLDTDYLKTKSAFIYALKIFKRNTVGPQIDYFRRSVRSNELFFEIPISDLYDTNKLKIISDDILPK